MLADSGGEAEHGEQRADGERDHERGRDASPPAPADAAQADLRRARQEADPPQEAVAGVLAADGGAGRLQRVAQRQAHGAADRGQRRQRGHEPARRGR